MKTTINHIKLTCIGLWISMAIVTWSCSKVTEIPVELQPPLVYEHSALKEIAEIIAQEQELTIFREVYSRSGVEAYMDSVRATTTDTLTPFTLFVPRDAAWQAMGYSLESVSNLSAEACRELIMYLTVRGRYVPTNTSDPVSGTNTLRPIIPARRYELQDDWGFIRVSHQPYLLYLAWGGGNIYLNGKEAGTVGNDIHPATDGAVYLVNTLPIKPGKTVYEILQEDESFSFYLAALDISNQVYQEYQVGIDPENRSEELFWMTPEPFMNDLSQLSSFSPMFGTITTGNLNMNNMYTVFAPDNEAFIRAGFPDIASIADYIRSSYVTTAGYVEDMRRRPRYTNMDSVLNHSFFARITTISHFPAFELARQSSNVNNQVVFTNDMLWNSVFRDEGIRRSVSLTFFDWTFFDESLYDFTQLVEERSELKLLFRSEGNRITIRRGDAPDGQVANVVLEQSDIVAMNGVIHRIDNLLLPNP
ncbi:Fasciclin domain-containing protein [Parapedobacter composti]|uniref:Fasciclin domain-containing protein n=1 Tax=Parapedobacter composti TaxID=623281 RepID=A0A1I1M7Q8_9SPHI|nr:fasciclin domain-containing protein [Parapedobacter composti]SFC78613.1 Fasciclin domain-containing protein [Parapedobacter composti]